VKQRIDAKVAEVQQRGHHCLVTRRSVNKGFKAGNMINGMSYLNEVSAHWQKQQQLRLTCRSNK
jgi:hypothetical protein